MNDQTALGGATCLGEPPQARIHCRRHGNVLSDETTHCATHYTHSVSVSAQPHQSHISGRHLIDELDRLAVDRGYPALLRCDNGPELA
jgi:hypothetical protein